MPNSIGVARVQRVRGYSDFADITVETASSGASIERGDTLFMQLSLNGQNMRFSQSSDDDERVYYRCSEY